jgi:hypothetical protein
MHLPQLALQFRKIRPKIKETTSTTTQDSMCAQTFSNLAVKFSDEAAARISALTQDGHNKWHIERWLMMMLHAVHKLYDAGGPTAHRRA